jgi:hypothetical protein
MIIIKKFFKSCKKFNLCINSLVNYFKLERNIFKLNLAQIKKFFVIIQLFCFKLCIYMHINCEIIIVYIYIILT